MCVRNHVRIVVALMLAAALISGCSSGGRMAESEKAVESLQDTRARVAKAQQQVDATLVTMNQLPAGGNLERSFKNYSEHVEDLEKSGQDARKRAESMRKNVGAYVDKWDKEAAAMEDPAIRAGLEQRRQTVRANFERVKAAAEAARAAYDPFLQRTQEIQRALAIDLTPANVNGLRPSIEAAQADGRQLQQRLKTLQAELDRIASGMSPQG